MKRKMLQFTSDEKRQLKNVENLLWYKLNDPEITIDYEERGQIYDAWRGLYETLNFKNLFESEEII